MVLHEVSYRFHVLDMVLHEITYQCQCHIPDMITYRCQCHVPDMVLHWILYRCQCHVLDMVLDVITMPYPNYDLIRTHMYCHGPTMVLSVNSSLNDRTHFLRSTQFDLPIQFS
ncbi:Tetratricopeptide repeat 14 [Gossypium arboreum]|uniref:Tetratricopeptide repeat 14 n=1 Tax=Gossypium arboreum TaxID=29729 RepID=A0A0B0P347_GOSAR|nr:Tetratricopeptide repeat 14 [Gossypium arboreum]